jgi:hypothetical protein
MATHFNDIQAALESHLSEMDYSIAWPNTDFTPSPNEVYLRASFLPADTVQAGLGSQGKDETTGIFQVDVVYPYGTGRSAIVDEIADKFKRGTVLSYNGVNVRVRSVSIAPFIRDDAMAFVPLSINFQSYTTAR